MTHVQGPNKQSIEASGMTVEEWEAKHPNQELGPDPEEIGQVTTDPPDDEGPHSRFRMSKMQPLTTDTAGVTLARDPETGEVIEGEGEESEQAKAAAINRRAARGRVDDRKLDAPKEPLADRKAIVGKKAGASSTKSDV